MRPNLDVMSQRPLVAKFGTYVRCPPINRACLSDGWEAWVTRPEHWGHKGWSQEARRASNKKSGPKIPPRLLVFSMKVFPYQLVFIHGIRNFVPDKIVWHLEEPHGLPSPSQDPVGPENMFAQSWAVQPYLPIASFSYFKLNCSDHGFDIQAVKTTYPGPSVCPSWQ